MVFALRGNPCNGCLKLAIGNTSFVRSIIIIMLALLRRQSTNNRLKLYDDSNFIFPLRRGKIIKSYYGGNFPLYLLVGKEIETVRWLCPKKLFVWIVNLCFLRDYYDNNTLTARSIKGIIMLQWPGVTFPPGYHYFIVNSATMALVA